MSRKAATPDAPPRIITVTYAYHPADNTPDLELPTDVLLRYYPAQIDHRLHTVPALELDIKENGIVKPLQLRTNGVLGLMTDGHQRLQIAVKLGIKKLPIQILPDSLRRVQSRGGYPPLSGELLEWVKQNLWVHEGHVVSRHYVGTDSGAGIPGNRYAKCECSCKAYWKEGR